LLETRTRVGLRIWPRRQPKIWARNWPDAGHILVFSSDPAFVEYDVVRGYLASKTKKEPGAIEVRYPPNLAGLFPGEKPGNELFDRKPLGREWEVSFYPSLADVDGLLLIGGGYTTKVAGLIAIGARTPLLLLAGFGGAAEDILESLRTDRHSIATENELNLMAQQTWTDNSAARCIDALLMQASRRLALEKQAELLESERKRTQALTTLAVTGSVLFVAVLLAITEAWHSDQLPRSFLLMLFGAHMAKASFTPVGNCPDSCGWHHLKEQ
jgi:hypothetical protein